MPPKKLTDGTPFQSDEEVYFHWFLEELVGAGYILSYRYEEVQLRLFDGLQGSYTEQLRTKTKERTFKVLGKRVYTPDFEIVWSPKAEGIFYDEMECGLPSDERAYFVAQQGVTLVEIKPNFDAKNMTRHVKALIDWAWQLHGRFVQLVVPFPKVGKTGKCSPSNTLFAEACVPNRYLYHNFAKGRRTINFKYKLLEEFIKERGRPWEETGKTAA